MLNLDSIPFDDSLGSDLEVSFPSRTRNKIFDPGILFEVQSKRFLSRDTFSISFIRDPLSLVFDTFSHFHPKMRKKSSILITPDYEASRAHGFVHRSLELHILSFIMGIKYPNLID
ncbi:hypothetical protein Tco_0890766 [Tanacetum coccineum]|uniref:Sulfotransferase n=1 Tax=Tanacetum coccineum TaxID=301880 RepID=A0ABQ5C6Z6_9ASTR